MTGILSGMLLIVLFITVTMLGKLSLTLVATKNACTHLLFPFQFFDFLFLYVFFSLRSIGDGVTVGWVTQQCLLQLTRPRVSQDEAIAD